MSRYGNDLLAELRDLGLTEGVATTVRYAGQSNEENVVTAGALEFSAPTLDEALEMLRDAVKDLPKANRPAAEESTTRTVAGESAGAGFPVDDRVIHDVGPEDL